MRTSQVQSGLKEPMFELAMILIFGCASKHDLLPKYVEITYNATKKKYEVNTTDLTATTGNIIIFRTLDNIDAHIKLIPPSPEPAIRINPPLPFDLNGSNYYVQTLVVSHGDPCELRFNITCDSPQGGQGFTPDVDIHIQP